MWANNYDARNGEPVWWHGRKAARSFAAHGVREAGAGDIETGDGTPLFVDGGPVRPPPRRPRASGSSTAGTPRPGSSQAVGHDPPRADLAADQLAAVVHPAGAARVIAPAGSGKTRVLTERLRHLWRTGRGPSTVTALAFNTKAADELRERCGGLVTARGPHIRTLNSVAYWICNEFGGRGGWQVLEEPRVRDMVQGVFEVRRQANTDTVLPYIDALSAVRLGLRLRPRSRRDSGRRAAWPRASTPTARPWPRRAPSTSTSRSTSPSRSCSATLRRGRPPRAAAALLVDEFQDLNPAHMLLIRLLSAPAFDCFGVGDDDQVIYGYSGATPDYLIRFGELLPRAPRPRARGQLPLPAGGRRRGAARALVQRGAGRQGDHDTGWEHRCAPAFGGPAAGLGPVAVLRAHAEPPRTAVATTLRGEAGVASGEIAVLSRVNSTLLPVQVALSEAGIPAARPLTADVLRPDRDRDGVAYLRMGLAPDAIRREDVAQTIRRPSRGIAPNVSKMLTERATTSVSDIRRLAGRLSGRDVSKLSDYADAIAAVATACRTTTAAAVRAVRTRRSAWGRRWTYWTRPDGKRTGRPTPTTSSRLESLAALHPDAATFESWLRAALGRRPSTRPGRAPVDGPQDQGPGMGARHRLRRLGGALPAPARATTKRGSVGCSTWR